MSDYDGLIPPGGWVALFAVVVLICGFLLWRLIQCPTNSLRWEDMVATKGSLNAYKVAFWIGVFVSSWVIIKSTYAGQMDAGIFAVYLGFLGGVPVGMSAISSRASAPRSRNDDDLPPAPPPRNSE